MTKFWVCPACDKRVEEYNEVVLMSGEHIRATVGKRLYGRLSDGKVYMFMVHIYGMVCEMKFRAMLGEGLLENYDITTRT